MGCQQRSRTLADVVTEAEKLLANHDALRKQMEDTFAVLAQRAFQNVGEVLAQNSKQQIEGSLETKKVARKSAGRTPNDLLSKCIAKIERLESESDAPEARIDHLIEAKGCARSAVETGIG